MNNQALEALREYIDNRIAQATGSDTIVFQPMNGQCKYWWKELERALSQDKDDGR